MRLRIDNERCTGHGRCYALAPELFDADDRGYGVVTVSDLPPDLIAQAQRAAGNCPENAISVE